MITIGKTKSVCPECMKVVPAIKGIGEDGIYLVKECNAHGKFQTLIWEGNAADYLSWGRENLSAETPVNPKVKEKSCPDNCGLCEEHERKGCCMILEVTKRCNMHCPVCFASAGEDREKGDIPICEIEKQYDFLMAHGGPFNIQLSGGEPTMRDDLPEIIHMGREKGFTFFQLNTNGIRLAREEGYAGKLKKAGLNTVFLQFDGVTDQVYETLRGQAMMELKKKAVLNCSEAELGIALVPVIAGISYEIIRLAGRSDNIIVRIISAPGLWMQKLTTKEPDEDMIEVAIASVEAVFDWKAYLKDTFGYEVDDSWMQDTPAAEEP